MTVSQVRIHTLITNEWKAIWFAEGGCSVFQRVHLNGEWQWIEPLDDIPAWFRNLMNQYRATIPESFWDRPVR